MILIGTGHKAGHGKSLFCLAIAEHCGHIGTKCKEYSISDLILREAIKNSLIPAGTVRSECTPEQVKILVDIGNERRAEDENYWVDQIAYAIIRDRPDVALIPNVRFPNEAKFVKAIYGFNVLVRRINQDGSDFISASRDPEDITETALDAWPWDFEILNMDRKPFWLRKQAKALFDYLRDGANER